MVGARCRPVAPSASTVAACWRYSEPAPDAAWAPGPRSAPAETRCSSLAAGGQPQAPSPGPPPRAGCRAETSRAGPAARDTLRRRRRSTPAHTAHWRRRCPRRYRRRWPRRTFTSAASGPADQDAEIRRQQHVRVLRRGSARESSPRPRRDPWPSAARDLAGGNARVGRQLDGRRGADAQRAAMGQVTCVVSRRPLSRCRWQR